MIMAGVDISQHTRYRIEFRNECGSETKSALAIAASVAVHCHHLERWESPKEFLGLA
jgi:hypothetical protein